MPVTYFHQIFQPEEEEEEEEEVRVIRKSEDNMSREFEKAARRLENARLVCGLSFNFFRFGTNCLGMN